MSDYERQLEEALARKSKEAEKNRKAVQSEAGLMSSLSQAFSKSETDSGNKEVKPESRSLEQMLAESSRKEAVPEKRSAAPFMTGTAAQPKQENIAAGVQPKEDEKTSVYESEPEKPIRYHKKEETGQTGRKDAASVVLAALLALILTAAGIGGGLFYALFTYLPMADAVNSSSCAAVLEGEYLTQLNSMAEEEGLGITFTRDALVGGQAVRDIKASLRAAYSGGSYAPDTELVGSKVASYAGDAGIGDTERLTARAAEAYGSFIEAAPDSTWSGQTGGLSMILLVIMIGGILVSALLLILLARRGKIGNLARFSFAGAAFLLEIISVIVMATGMFRRYSAAYSYIEVLSTRYMMGGIIACMAVGAFYMVVAAGTAVISSK